MKKHGRRIAMVAAAGLVVAALSGCMPMPQQTQETEQQAAQKANCAYMEQVNAVFADLDTALDPFDSAVAAGDYQTIRTTGAQALGTLDELDSITVPEALADVHGKYVSGSQQLGQAISEYIAIYGSISESSSQKGYSVSAVNARIAKVQRLYDAGISDLLEADKLALEMK